MSVVAAPRPAGISVRYPVVGCTVSLAGSSKPYRCEWEQKQHGTTANTLSQA
jgi:hypothetical protein